MSKSIHRIAAALAAAILLAPVLGAQNLFLKARNPSSPIDDHRAARVGDILTIAIDETSKVKNQDKVRRNNESNLSWRLEQWSLGRNTFNTPLPAVDSRTKRDMIGDAKQEKDMTFTARISVVVVDVQPNGNLVIVGTRLVQIDDDIKTLRISGLVRALDVKSDNTVTSSQVADARVSLTSEGGNARFVTRGPMGTFFDTLVWAAWPF